MGGEGIGFHTVLFVRRFLVFAQHAKQKAERVWREVEEVEGEDHGVN